MIIHGLCVMYGRLHICHRSFDFNAMWYSVFVLVDVEMEMMPAISFFEGV